jgi:hypothetical protein
MKIAGVPISGGGGGGSSIYKLTNQTLLASSWTTSGSYYIYSFSNPNITPTTYIDFTPYNNSTNEAISAMILPQISASDGSCIFYSSFLPVNNMTGDITISTTV